MQQMHIASHVTVTAQTAMKHRGKILGATAVVFATVQAIRVIATAVKPWLTASLSIYWETRIVHTTIANKLDALFLYNVIDT